ncbi:T-cell immunoglobulin and mucin domain-containing protein 4-like [Rhinatrema bivittatum]|uniref:T-cell immunoglobulin and mucin domain-containing protein 4-like n=1 Tax=Rhinatrema bivittatum TaxID=194408 RepID=UPI00112DA126|nr:T-cell immunoglobulin and mucin domain-containing protein 4-like [Rhinatrema bivittatum]
MSHSALLLWIWIQLCAVQTVFTLTVRGGVGHSVTLPCRYTVSSESDITTMCWGRGNCPNSKCNDEILQTDGRKVISKTSSRYQLRGAIPQGDVSLTIQNANEKDGGTYCCRVEIHGWFNDLKLQIRLQMYRVPTTPPTTTRATTPTTTTAIPITTTMTEATFTTLPVQTCTEEVITDLFSTAKETVTAIMENNFMSTATDTLTEAPSTPPTTRAVTEATLTTLPVQMSTETGTANLFSAATETVTTVMENNFTSPATDALTTGFPSEIPTVITQNPKSSIEKTENLSMHEQNAAPAVSDPMLITIVCTTLLFCFLGLLLAFIVKGKILKKYHLDKVRSLDSLELPENLLNEMPTGRGVEENLYTL